MKKILLSIWLLGSALSLLADSQLYKYQLAQQGDYFYKISGKTIVKASCKNGNVVGTIFEEKYMPESAEMIENFLVLDDESKVLIETNTHLKEGYKEGEYYVLDTKREKIIPVSETGTIAYPTFSPNGRMIAFVRDNNVVIKRLDFETEFQVTKDGKENAIYNGASREMMTKNLSENNVLDWSADSRFLSYVRYDYSQTPVYEYVNYVEKGKSYTSKFQYTTAGDAMPQSTLALYDVQTRGAKKLTLPQMEDAYIPYVKFTTVNDSMMVCKLNRKQNALEIYSVNPRSGVSKLVVKEESKNYISPENIKVTFVNGNRSFIINSDRDGHNHLYMYSLTGILQKQLTKGDYDVELIAYDEDKQLIYYSAENAIRSMDLKQKETTIKSDFYDKKLLSYSPNYYIIESSDLNASRVDVLGAKGEQLCNIVENKSMFQREIFSVDIDGKSQKGWMIRPAGFNLSTKYPVLLIQEDVLSDSDLMFEHFIANEGVVVVHIVSNLQQDKKDAYRKMGIYESEMLTKIAQKIVNEEYVDSNKISVLGKNLGGLAVLYASANEIFHTAVAISPVVDWTSAPLICERFASVPQENFSGYRNNTIDAIADNVKVNLLLVHGTSDTVIPFENTMVLSQKMVEKAKQFDMQIYANEGNCMSQKAIMHLAKKVADFCK